MEQCLPCLNYLREANTMKLLSGDFSKHNTTAKNRTNGTEAGLKWQLAFVENL